MKKLLLTLAALCSFGAFVLPSVPAHAQASRTWISGVGDDVNPCSRTAPCKTFAGAISKTAAGGEINCLDPGGFGAVTITKAITLDCTGTQGSVLVSGTSGIVINAGTGKVVLRHLEIQGIGTGIHGVNIIAAGQVTVDNCRILGFTGNGINMAVSATTALLVFDTSFTQAAKGIAVSSSAGFAIAHIERSSFFGMTTAGIEAGSAGFASVSNSFFLQDAIGASAVSTGTLSVDTSWFTNNPTGVSAAAGTQVRVSNNSLYDNTNAFVVNGTLSSAGNNHIVGATGNPNGAAYVLK